MNFRILILVSLVFCATFTAINATTTTNILDCDTDEDCVSLEVAGVSETYSCCTILSVSGCYADSIIEADDTLYDCSQGMITKVASCIFGSMIVVQLF
jgi:hypothetical protein